MVGPKSQFSILKPSIESLNSCVEGGLGCLSQSRHSFCFESLNILEILPTSIATAFTSRYFVEAKSAFPGPCQKCDEPIRRTLQRFTHIPFPCVCDPVTQNYRVES